VIFEPKDFQKWSEADVREEIIAPLLRQLSYGAGTSNNIIREQSLRYDRVYLGRKDPKNDRPLRGRADYICEVDGSIRWVIEAKPPSAEISLDDIEQAYSYAIHGEIRAVYFCVCNGHELRVYQTNQSPEVGPLLTVPYNEFNEKFGVIENLLSPASIRRDWPIQVLDVGKPLGPGLRSMVRVVSGYIEYTQNNWNIASLNELTLTITEGAIERNENNQMVAYLKSRVPFISLQRLNEKIGMAQFEVISNDSVVSTDQNTPTVFTASRRLIVPAGERVFDFTRGAEVTLPINLMCDTETLAEGFLKDYVFSGSFLLKIRYSSAPRPIEMRGRFEIYVA
jgi:hypothetical protein